MGASFGWYLLVVEDTIEICVAIGTILRSLAWSEKTGLSNVLFA